METEEQRAVAWVKAHKFAYGRVSVGELNLPPETGFQTIYKPMLAGCFVRNRDDPPDGFCQYADAVSAARKYRASCLDYIEQHGEPEDE